MMDYREPLVRALRIIQLLSSKRKLTVIELFETFDRKVQKRTLQRDLLKISEAGIPLISEKGKGNENIWTLDARFYQYIPSLLSFNEYLASYFLRKAMPVFRNISIEKEFNALIEKLDQLLPSDIFHDVSIESDQIEDSILSLEFGTFDYGLYGNVIDSVIDGIVGKKNCSITYKSPDSKESKTYDIEPYKLLIYKGALYLVAFNRKYEEFNHFAINRIESITVTSLSFNKDQKYEETQFFKDRFGLTSAPAEEIILHIDRTIVPYIEGRIWHHSQKLIENEDGSMNLEMKASISEELAGWIFSWQGGITVIKPQPLKSYVLLKALMMADKLKGKK